MRNIRLLIEYDGTCYYGWQIQKDLPTVQGTIQKAILNLTGELVTIYGAGRTDTGVHALGQVANFHTNSLIPSSSFNKAINSYLPDDIIVKNSVDVPEDFHSQFCAISKTYTYRIYCSSTPKAVGRNYFHWVWFPVDLDKMKQGVEYLIGRHDFSAFEAALSPRKSSIRTVKNIDIVNEDCYIEFTIKADGFLYRMVRNIVGTLLEVGRGRYPSEEVKKILESKERRLAGPTLPAKGLFLKNVEY